MFNICGDQVSDSGGDGDTSTLDLVCKNPQEYEIWTKGLMWLAENKHRYEMVDRETDEMTR